MVIAHAQESRVVRALTSDHNNVALARLAAEVEAALAARSYPVSPSLRCVTALTLFFFGVYLAVVCARLVRLAGRWASPGKPYWNIAAFEARLLEAAESALGLAPMLAVLMTSCRLRTMQLDPNGGRPQPWVTPCMYASTAAFFLRFVLDLGFGGRAAWGSPLHRVFQCFYCLASFVLYGVCACIIAFGALAQPGPDWPAGKRVPSLSPMFCCVAALTATYLSEHLLLEALRALRPRARAGFPGPPPAQQETWPEAAAPGQASPPAPAPAPWQRMHRGAGSGPAGASLDSGAAGSPPRAAAAPEAQSLSELLSLHFPIMVCVLLVAIEVRAVQLRLQPDAWAAAAMYMTTASIIVQAAWAAAKAVARSQVAPAQDAPNRLTSFVRSAPLWPPTSSPGGADAAAGTERPIADVVLAGIWLLVLGGLYLGTAVILASVADMEDMDWLPEDEDVPMDGVDASMVRTPKEKPLSVTMGCVMLLTVVYFGIYLCMIIGNVVGGASRRWVEGAIGSVQRGLAFVPMLCVMMIAVRLRAMQLAVRDPQPWAQKTMYVATCAVVVQAACSLRAGPPDGDGLEDDKANTHLAGKVALICLLALRYTATLLLYVCVAVLVAALVVMEPALAMP